MSLTWFLLAALTTLGSSSATAAEPQVAKQVRQVQAIPDAVRKSYPLPDFYQQWVDLDGLPLVASAKVSPTALLEAAYLLDTMLAARQDIRPALIKAHVRVAIMAPTELTCDIPEHADLQPHEYWNLRARGLGATPHRPCVSGAEENLLTLRGDPYTGENILMHEFAHGIHEMGMRNIDTMFEIRLKEAFRAAQQAGLWKGTYAMTNPSEYWAEGTQVWFHCNRAHDHQHNHIVTREQIKTYDPALAVLLEQVYGDTAWRYTPPTARVAKKGAGADHLQQFDPNQLEKFKWPAELLEWKKNQRSKPD